MRIGISNHIKILLHPKRNGPKMKSLNQLRKPKPSKRLLEVQQVPQLLK